MEPDIQEIHDAMNGNAPIVLSRLQGLVVEQLEKDRTDFRKLEAITAAYKNYAEAEMSRNAITGSLAEGR